MKLTLTGVADTRKVLQLMQERVANQGVRKAVRAGANVIREAIEQLTPVQAGRNLGSNSLEPGELQADIGVRMKTKDGNPTAIIGPGPKTAHVAGMVEYGHRAVTGGYSRVQGFGRVRGPGKIVGNVPAHPFIRPAFESSVAPAREAFTEEIAKQVKGAVTS